MRTFPNRTFDEADTWCTDSMVNTSEVIEAEKAR